jgi:hypothetical protein
VPSPVTVLTWIDNPPDVLLFPFNMNKRTKLKAIPTIVEHPQVTYDIPTGTGVLIKLRKLLSSPVAEPKALVRWEVWFFVT